jgi:hypothetical protein
VAVGTFTDQRGGESRQLGAIRGGFGNPLKTHERSEDASVVVNKAFAQALANRGLLAASGSALYTLSGVINKLNCSQLVRLEAHAELVVSLIDDTSGKQLLQRTVRGDIVNDASSAFATGVGGSVEDLRAMAARALQDAIDNALASPQFTQAMAGS